MRRRAYFYVAAACVASVAPLPADAAEITKITWEITGGCVSFVTPCHAPDCTCPMQNSVTGGSLTYKPVIPLVTPCSAGGCAGSGSALLSLTGPGATIQAALFFPDPLSYHYTTVSPSLFRLFLLSVNRGTITGNQLGVRVSGSPLAAFGEGTFIPTMDCFDCVVYAFTLGNEVRTMVPEVPALSQLGLGLLGFLLMAFAALGLRHRGVGSVTSA